uniref:MBG domain-containing protein n=1 Tax=Pedobacter nototheniae TaxID=2488994 RepID=UPI002930B7C6
MLLLILGGISLRAQTALVAGDIAFTGYVSNLSGGVLGNEFSFVILRTGGISATTTINFTDNGWNSLTSSLGTAEGTLTWTSTTALAQFTEVRINIDAAGGALENLSAGSVSAISAPFILSQAGDQVLAYQGTSVSPTFISGIQMNSEIQSGGNSASTSVNWDVLSATGWPFASSRSAIPPGLTSGVSALWAVIGSEFDNAIFNCVNSTASSLANLKTKLFDPVNWRLENPGTSGIYFSTPSGCTYAIASPPVITGNPPNRTICVNGSTTFGVSATGASSYQWQVSTDGGTNFSDISNGAPYSGATTSVLTVTGAPGSLTSYRYRAIATNTEGSVTSNNATLTISNMVSSVSFQTNVSCFNGTNGSATVSVSGGIPLYSYSWSPAGGTGATATGLAAGTYTVTITDNIGCTKTQTVTIAQPAAAITATTSQSNVSCNGGSNGVASVNVSGGTPGYTYSWAPSGGTAATASGLTAGAYTVTITDANSCTTTRSFTITQPSLITATTSQINVSCNGGSNGVASVIVSGGAGNYTYSWSPSGGTGATASGLVPGIYTVTITDANSCTATRSFTITQPSLITATSSQTNVSCNGGSNGTATVSVSGGAGSYTYSWSPSGGTAATASGLVAGAYTVTIIDANFCIVSRNFTITQPSPIAATSSQTNVSCNGGSNGTATVSVSGGAGGYTYSWSPSGGTAATATGLTPGIYTVTITDANSCTATRSFTVTQPTAITATSSQTNVSCNGGSNGVASVSVLGGAGGYTYSWFPSGGTAATASGLVAGAYTVTITDANSCTATRTFTVTQPTAITATSSQTNVSCNGGSNGTASVTPSGGAGGYTYSWSPSGGTNATASGLAVGNYTVTITDANLCTATRSFTITQPSAITATTSQTNVSCNGGSNGVASVSVSGGAGGYTYSWAPSGGTGSIATGLAAGVYTVTIMDANTCTTSRSITIAQPTVITATTSQSNVSCNGGANGVASVSVSGGAGGYTYSWSPSGGTSATATGLTSGIYTVTITDANFCTATRSVTITQPTTITSTISQTNVSCNGGSNGTATVTPSGGAGGYTYSWSPSGGTAATATGLTPGTYTVTITDANSCMTTRTFTITQPSVITATSSQTNVSCNGGTNGVATVSVSGGAGGYTYSWTPSGGTGATASGLAAGIYTVTITDANSCTATRSFTITQPTAITATTSQTNVSCNGGANGTASVTPSGGVGAYTYSWAPTGGTGATATGLIPGVYTVTITDANSCTATRSFTITQPSAIAAAASQTNVSCNGGSNGTATVTPSGGTGGYTYSWSPSGGTAATATGLVAGAYSVLITDANGCAFNKNFTITQPSVLVATTSQINAVCNGSSTGMAAVAVSGGAGSYTYSWSPSGGTAALATGLTAGNYTVTITDANFCTIIKNVVITQPPVLVVTPSQTNVLCNGGSNGSATVAVSGGTGAYTYAWAPSGGTAATASGLTAGTYTVTIKDVNLCQTTQSFIITQPNPIVLASVTLPQAQVANIYNSSVSATGGVGTYTYTITSGALPAGLTLSTGGLISGTPTASGTFNFDIKATDSGCSQSSTSGFSITSITSDQTITFNSIPTQVFGNGPVTLTATSTSGLNVSFASDNAAVATISGNVLTINGAGTANITASQAGGSGYNPAPDVIEVLTVDQAAASIALSNLAQIYDGTAKAATATTTPAGLSGLSITYDGSTTVPTAAGTYAVVASLNNTNYTAPDATGSLVIAPKVITVTADAKS